MKESELKLYKQDIALEYQEFKKCEGFSKVVGIIGGGDSNNLSFYQELILCALSEVSKRIDKFAILSGGTNSGIPDLALNVANNMGVPVIGVFPDGMNKYVNFDKLDFAISVKPLPLSETTWGSETTTLVSIPDIFILIGGEWGTTAEIAMIMKRNKSLLKDNKQPIPILVLKNSGGIADSLSEISKKIPSTAGVIFEFETPDNLISLILKELN